MNHGKIIELYEQSKLKTNNIIKHNGNGDHDYDAEPLHIKLEVDNSFKGSSTIKLEHKTIEEVQNFLSSTWEFKNATNGINFGDGLLLVEHKQHKRIEDKEVPSGISISKSKYWVLSIDDIGFITLRTEFLKWLVEYNKRTKLLTDKEIPSQEGGNQGYALYIPYDKLAFLFRQYKEHLNK
jgi:hypothetical protein